jgi:L-threonylcarbamoyladenylate synthase
MPTDTIYGILTSALLPNSVERVYEIREREKSKPCIILISDFKDLEKFGIEISEYQKEEILKEKDRALTFILDCNNESLFYLHRGNNSLAFRIPKDENLRNLIKETGPLLAPSANKAGEKPSLNIKEAKEYFGDLVDLYIDGDEIVALPSKIIKFEKDRSIKVIRE